MPTYINAYIDVHTYKLSAWFHPFYLSPRTISTVFTYNHMGMGVFQDQQGTLGGGPFGRNDSLDSTLASLLDFSPEDAYPPPLQHLASFSSILSRTLSLSSEVSGSYAPAALPADEGEPPSGNDGSVEMLTSLKDPVEKIQDNFS